MYGLKIGVPTNETLYPAISQLLELSGINVKREPKRFLARAGGLEFIFARMSEIARLVNAGKIHCGFVTKDWWAEANMRRPFTPINHLTGRPWPVIVKEFPDLCRCRLALIASHYWWASDIKEIIPNILVGFMGVMKRSPVIATRFPYFSAHFLSVQKGITKSFLSEKLKLYDRHAYEIHFRIVEGSEELYVLLDAADFAIAQVESGETIRNHDLWIVENILESHLLLVGNNSQKVNEFAARLH
mgnify:FL=1